MDKFRQKTAKCGWGVNKDSLRFILKSLGNPNINIFKLFGWMVFEGLDCMKSGMSSA